MIPSVYLLEVGAEEVPADDRWLSDEEMNLLGRLRFDKRRRDWRLGRWTAKRAVALRFQEAGSCPPLGAITIRAAPDGAPEAFTDGLPVPLVISLSHRDRIAICAVSAGGVALGCDIERVEPRTPAFVADYFTDAERAVVDGSYERERPEVCTLLWSAKESALKALRTGLRADTRSVQVSLAPCAVAAMEVTHEQSAPIDRWRPFMAREAITDRIFGGWWKERGQHLVTVATDPPAGPPFPLVDRMPAVARQD